MNEDKSAVTTQSADKIVKKVVAAMHKRVKAQIPGDSYSFAPGKPSVRKDKVIGVLLWIIKQTEGFKIPVRVYFMGGEAEIIGDCIGTVLFEFPEDLSAMNTPKTPMPSFFTVRADDSRPAFLRFSNLSKTQGGAGQSLDGVWEITIRDVSSQPLAKVVPLSEVLS